MDSAVIAKPPSPSFLKSLLTADASMNYNFIAAIYTFLSLISLLFFILERYAVADSIHGFWLVPAPCLPCLVYVLFLRSKAKESAPVVEKKNQ